MLLEDRSRSPEVVENCGSESSIDSFGSQSQRIIICPSDQARGSDKREAKKRIASNEEMMMIMMLMMVMSFSTSKWHE